MSHGELETPQIANTVAVNVSVNVFVSVRCVIMRAAGPRCFNAFCPVHGGIDSSMDSHNRVLKRDERMDGWTLSVTPHWILFGGEALVRSFGSLHAISSRTALHQRDPLFFCGVSEDTQHNLAGHTNFTRHYFIQNNLGFNLELVC